MDENVQNTEMQDAIPAEQETQQEVIAEDTATTAPDEQPGTEDTTARDEGTEVTPPESDLETAPAVSPFLSVQYNHEDRPLTREETVDLVQIGLHHKALHQKLDYAAAISGTDVNALIDNIIKAPEEAHRKHLEELYGEGSDDVEIGMEIFRKKQGENYDKIVADRASAAKAATEEQEKSTQSRLAEEYIELKREIPDVPEYSQLPDEVIVEAAKGKRDLMSCYLRYQHRENQKIAAANATAQEAAKASAGTMGTDTVEKPSSADAFIKGLRSI